MTEPQLRRWHGVIEGEPAMTPCQRRSCGSVMARLDAHLAARD